jgi:hypothetical protein
MLQSTLDEGKHCSVLKLRGEIEVDPILKEENCNLRYIYIYIWREREREFTNWSSKVREREREREILHH